MNQSHYGASVCNIKVTNFEFANDAVIFVESQEVLVRVLRQYMKKQSHWALRSLWPRPRSKCLVVYWMKLYDLPMST